MATEKTWETILRTNSADLLVLIDTENGLEGAVKTLGLGTNLQRKNIWGIKDNTIKRNERLLEFIRKGDFERFKIFCDALEKSGQKPIVTRHLSEIKETWSTCSNGSNDPRSSIALKESYRDCLRLNWNYLMERLDNLIEVEAQLKARGSLTTFQQIQMQDYKEDVDKVCFLLRLLENGSQKLFDDFCDILRSTKMQDRVVTYLTPSGAQRRLDEVKKTFLEVKLEPASDIECQRKLKEIEAGVAYPVSNGVVTGRVLIFSNRYFVKQNLKPRHGTEYDEANIKDFFKQKSKFQTDIYTDMTSQEMRKTLTDETSKGMGDVDIFIVFFMSHGRNGEIYGMDAKTILTSEIVDLLCCPQLAGKPKLIFIQACRDVSGIQASDETDGITPVLEMNNLTMSDAGAEVKTNPVPIDAVDAIPEVQALPTYHPKADMAIFYATVRGDTANRREDEGSFFVRHLLDVFTKKAHTEDVVTMVTEALRRVHELQIEKRQLGEVKSSLLRKVYLVI